MESCENEERRYLHKHLVFCDLPKISRIRYSKNVFDA